MPRCDRIGRVNSKSVSRGARPTRTPGWCSHARTGRRPDPHSISEHFEQRTRAAGLPAIRFHDLRHTYATLALSAGVHPKVVSDRLGHSTISITLDTYSHVLPELAEQEATRMGELILGAGEA